MGHTDWRSWGHRRSSEGTRANNAAFGPLPCGGEAFKSGCLKNEGAQPHPVSCGPPATVVLLPSEPQAPRPRRLTLGSLSATQGVSVCVCASCSAGLLGRTHRRWLQDGRLLLVLLEAGSGSRPAEGSSVLLRTLLTVSWVTDSEPEQPTRETCAAPAGPRPHDPSTLKGPLVSSARGQGLSPEAPGARTCHPRWRV